MVEWSHDLAKGNLMNGDTNFLIGFAAGVLTVFLYVALNLNPVVEVLLVTPMAYGALALSRRI